MNGLFPSPVPWSHLCYWVTPGERWTMSRQPRESTTNRTKTPSHPDLTQWTKESGGLLGRAQWLKRSFSIENPTPGQSVGRCHGNRCRGSAVAYKWTVSSLGLEDGCKDTSSCPQMHLMHIACICRISLPYKLFYDIFVIVTWKGFTGLITFIGLGFGVNSFLFVDSRDLFFFFFSILCHSLIL